MLESIIGDIGGSIYEFSNIKTKDFPFFSKKKEFTDDSVLTVATADWLLSGGEPARFYAAYASKYPYPMGDYGSVPQAIVAFLDGNDFKDSIRNAISIGGDSDTIGFISGGIAEAFYGIPKDLYDQGMAFLDDNLRFVVERFEEKFGNKVLVG